MILKRFFQGVIVLSLTFASFPAWSAGSTSTCKELILKQETQKGIPQGLLKAIATVESGISPWAVNARGRSYIFRSKEEAAKYVRQLVQQGFGNFSVGCMQLHYDSHRRHFSSIEAMFEPENNIAHAAKLIKRLERRYGSLERAVKLYHSACPTYHNRYQKRVFGLWAKFQGSKKPQNMTLNAAPLKTVALQNVTMRPQQTLVKTPRQSIPIKFGVGAALTRKDKREKA